MSPTLTGDTMSKLYAKINKSARRTIPTARGHSTVETTVQNWGYAIETRIEHAGGAGADICTCTLVILATGQRFEIFRKSLLDLRFELEE